MFHLLISYSVTFINDHVLITTNQGSKKLAFHLALQTSSSQLLLALGKSSFTFIAIWSTEDFPGPIPLGQVRMKVTRLAGTCTYPRQLESPFFKPC